MFPRFYKKVTPWKRIQILEWYEQIYINAIHCLKKKSARYYEQFCINVSHELFTDYIPKYNNNVP